MMEGGTSWRMIKHYAIAIIVAVSVALLIRIFVIEAYRVPSFSMKPTLEPGDTIFVKKLSYFTENNNLPKYGQVVVFRPISDEPLDYIKRIVGLPGDKLQIKTGQLLLNGKNITQTENKNDLCGKETLPGISYLVCWEPPVMDDFGPVVVPKNSVFVLGDYRSKAGSVSIGKGWGIIPISTLKGEASFVWLSVEPPGGAKSNLFSRIRLERMFQRIH